MNESNNIYKVSINEVCYWRAASRRFFCGRAC